MFGFFKKKVRMTAEDLLTLAADQLVNPAGGSVNPGQAEFRKPVVFARLMTELRICLVLLAAAEMKVKAKADATEWDGVTFLVLRAYAEQWAIVPGSSKQRILNAAQNTSEYLHSPNTNREFENALWSSFGSFNSQGEKSPPPIALLLVLPMLREQYLALLDLFESVKLVPRLGSERPPPPNLQPPDA